MAEHVESMGDGTDCTTHRAQVSTFNGSIVESLSPLLLNGKMTIILLRSTSTLTTAGRLQIIHSCLSVKDATLAVESLILTAIAVCHPSVLNETLNLHLVSEHRACNTDTLLINVGIVKFDEVEQSRASIHWFFIELGSVFCLPFHLRPPVSG